GSKVRHRLNQRGNRQLNWALHVIAISQLRHDTLGRQYFDRKVAEGNTFQGGNPLAQATDFRRRLPTPRSRRPTAELTPWWAREDNQERPRIQRDRLYILNSRLFG
ncbi:MAG: transposase, partial [Ilumatobacter sp.]